MNPTEPVQLDPERQKRAKAYARINRRWMVVDLGLTALFSLAWLLLGWSAGLRTWLAQWTATPWLLVPLFAAIFGGIFYLVDLPLSYYTSFVLPHRFDQSTETFAAWVIDELKGLAVGALMGGLLLEILYAVLRAYPQTWWMWAALILLVFSVLLANLAPVLLMPLFNKFVPIGPEHQDLVDRLVRLFDRAGARVQGVYTFDLSRRTKSANAALTGLGATRRIILGDTLLATFSADEIETVLAHELGHHVNRDIPWMIAFQAVLTTGGLWLAAQGLNWGVGLLQLQGTADIAALPLFLLVMGAYGLVTMPLGNALSRWRERKADAYALETTRRPAAFASAMTRLANQNLAEVDPEPWAEFLLHSHPALRKRIALAQAFQAKMGVEAPPSGAPSAG